MINMKEQETSKIKVIIQPLEFDPLENELEEIAELLEMTFPVKVVKIEWIDPGED